MIRASLLIVSVLLVAGCQNKEATESADLDSMPVDSVSSGSIGSDTLAALQATSDSAVQSSSLDAPDTMDAPIQSAPAVHAPAAVSAPLSAVSTPSAAPAAAPKTTLAVPHAATPSGFGDQDLTVDLGAYARKVTNPAGEHVFPRSDTGIDIVTACTGYRGPDLAQTAFIKAGGPQQDPLGLDPDGDGYACGWDPAPFR